MSKFEEKIASELNKQVKTLFRESNELSNKYMDDCVEIGVNPDAFFQTQFNNAKLYRLLYIAVQEYHNRLSQHLREVGIALPDLDSLFSCAEDHQA